ncbi:MAG: bifunctional phosphoglucose/phosphomannose isomerase [Candidatus Bathyarchaeum sp.]|nr:MAG: bifunctional phosphoglucose/phosphomannose isomerase [Candidatus Bathyarchaeum sp.]
MVTILDNQERVKEVDKSGMLNHLVKTPNYCRDAIKRTAETSVPSNMKPKNIVIIGMGGSAIGGEILKDWLRDELPIPIEVCRDYTLPAYANKDTLVIANSYSGNTEETLSAFLAANKRKCTTIAITSGGQLEALCKKMQLPHVTIPEGLPPRAAIPYLFFPLPVLMEKMGILSNIGNELEEAIQVLEKIGKTNSPSVPTEDNKAKKLAHELMDTIPVIYGFRQYGAIAHRLKTQFNENSKVPSKHDVFPELNHNTTVGWEAPETLTKNYSIILIRDPAEPPEIKNRIETTTALAFSKAKKVLQINAEGTGKLAKMLSVLCIGDFASVYLAILQNKDPTPVEIIDRVKRELAKKTA